MKMSQNVDQSPMESTARLDGALVGKAFSGFRAGLDERFFALMIREFAGSLLPLVFDHYCTTIATRRENFMAMLQHPVTETSRALWCPELGACLDALKTDRPAAVQRAVAQIALNLLAEGVSGEFTFQFSEPCSLHWDCFLLPECSGLTVCSDCGSATVSIMGAHPRETIFFQEQKPHGWQSQQAITIPHLKLRLSRVLLLEKALIKKLRTPELPGTLIAKISCEEKQVSGCMNFLYENFSAVGLWIDRVLRYLEFTEGSAGTMKSGSYDNYFGLIQITSNPDILKTAEMLLHETCHHYYFLLRRFGALTQEDDKNLYYSPFTRRMRPPDRIMLGYHAFVNVELFYRECVQAGVATVECGRAFEQVARDVDLVQSSLLSEIKLTALGRSVVKSLMEFRSAYAPSYKTSSC